MLYIAGRSGIIQVLIFFKCGLWASQDVSLGGMASSASPFLRVPCRILGDLWKAFKLACARPRALCCVMLVFLGSTRQEASLDVVRSANFQTCRNWQLFSQPDRQEFIPPRLPEPIPSCIAVTKHHPNLPPSPTYFRQQKRNCTISTLTTLLSF